MASILAEPLQKQYSGGSCKHLRSAGQGVGNFDQGSAFRGWHHRGRLDQRWRVWRIGFSRVQAFASIGLLHRWRPVSVRSACTLDRTYCRTAPDEWLLLLE